MSIKEIASKINKVFPLEKAQLEWDNVGVLIDTGSVSDTILLTIDITENVLQECLEKNIKNIVSYHPIIFRPIKSLNYEKDIVTILIKNNINVFSPHTSWDEVMNNYIFGLFNKSDFIQNEGRNERKIQEIIASLKEATGKAHTRVALCKKYGLKDTPPKMVVGVGSAFKYHSFVDSVIITGEMEHHVLLHSLKNNNSVILLEHSNSERICLDHFKSLLEKELTDFEITISANDKDPIEII